MPVLLNRRDPDLYPGQTLGDRCGPELVQASALPAGVRPGLPRKYHKKGRRDFEQHRQRLAKGAGGGGAGYCGDLDWRDLGTSGG